MASRDGRQRGFHQIRARNRQGLGRPGSLWHKADMRSTHRADVTPRGTDLAGPHGWRSPARRARLFWTTTFAAAAVFAIPWVSTADSKAEARYPFDPACPWGRLANGKGMITRCLSEEEARALLAGGTITTTGGTTVTVPGISETSRPTPPPKTNETSATAPDSSGSSPAKPPEEAAPPDQPEPPTVRPVRVEVGPIIPDEGTLTIGRLDKPIDRYRACVEQNGGLSGSSGEVRVHFLVRGERSRAEGVEVTDFRGVSKKAAQCIADVVDRRVTGTPSLPMVGATLVFKLSS